jgi:hypothetical protein
MAIACSDLVENPKRKEKNLNENEKKKWLHNEDLLVLSSTYYICFEKYKYACCLNIYQASWAHKAWVILLMASRKEEKANG